MYRVPKSEQGFDEFVALHVVAGILNESLGFIREIVNCSCTELLTPSEAQQKTRTKIEIVLFIFSCFDPRKLSMLTKLSTG